MSVIYGLVNPNEAIDQSIIYKIKSSLEFPIDLHNDLINNELYFSCAQKSDSLSKDFDSSPLEDKSLKLSITADALATRLLILRDRMDQTMSGFLARIEADKDHASSDDVLKYLHNIDCPHGIKQRAIDEVGHMITRIITGIAG